MLECTIFIFDNISQLADSTDILPPEHFMQFQIFHTKLLILRILVRGELISAKVQQFFNGLVVSDKFNNVLAPEEDTITCNSTVGDASKSSI